MPVYKYECNECGNTFSITLQIGEKYDLCPFCGLRNAKRIYSMPLILNRSDIKVRIRKPGELVKEFIEKIDKEVNKEKEKERLEDMTTTLILFILLFAISITVNIILIKYIRTVITSVIPMTKDFKTLEKDLEEYELFLTELAKKDLFYDDPTLITLIRYTKFMCEMVNNYRKGFIKVDTEFETESSNNEEA